MYDMEQAEREQEQQGKDVLPGKRCIRLSRQGDLAIIERVGGEINRQTADEDNRGGNGEKRERFKVVVGIDKEVLRIANGREHAAQVRRNGLPADCWHHKPYAPRLGKDHNGQRHKDNQCHIIGDEHGTEIAAENKEPAQRPPRGAALKQMLEDSCKKAAEPQPRHNTHQKE